MDTAWSLSTRVGSTPSPRDSCTLHVLRCTVVSQQIDVMGHTGRGSVGTEIRSLTLLSIIRLIGERHERQIIPSDSGHHFRTCRAATSPATLHGLAGYDWRLECANVG